MSFRLSDFFLFCTQVSFGSKSRIHFVIDFNFRTLLANESANLAPRVSHLNAWGVNMRDPGNEVVRVPVRPDFAEKRFNYSAVCSWLVGGGIFQAVSFFLLSIESD